MNKLYTTLLIACIAVGFTACNDDDCDDLHLGNLANYPNVLKGTIPNRRPGAGTRRNIRNHSGIT